MSIKSLGRAIGLVAFFLVIGAMAYYGQKGNNLRAAQLAERAARVAKLVTTPEPLTVTVPAKPPTRYFHTDIFNPGGANREEGWITWEAEEVVLVSSNDHGATLCPEVLNDFIAANEWVWGTLPQIEQYRSQLGGTQAQVWARVIRFANKPDLSRCPDMTWDSSSKELQFRGKRMALFSANQPHLSLALSGQGVR